MGKSLREQLVEQGRMAALGTLCGGVAHELSNPLAYLITNLRYLAEELPRMMRDGRASAKDLDEVEQTIADALEGAARVGGLVGELRGYASAPSDGQEAVDVRAVLDRASALVRADMRRRARLFKDYEGSPLAFANEGRLSHVLLALLSHVARALPDDAPMRHEVHVACRAVGPLVEIAVFHTGEPPSANAIDGPPESAEAVDLAVCRAVVESMGGRMTIEPRDEHVAIVVTLPAPVSERESLPPRAA